MGVPGSETIRSRKTTASGTSQTLATADDSKLTPPVGLQVAIVALSCSASTNFSATGSIAIRDGATALISFVPGAVINHFVSFSPPLKITSGTNDLQIVITGTTAAAAIAATVWYTYV